MSYQPDFNRHDVLARTKKCTEFVESHLKNNESRQISKMLLQQQFGNTSRPLGAWLRNFLLEVVDPYYNMNTGRCITYRQRPGAVDELRALAGVSSEYVPTDELQQQILTGEFDYQEKSDRWYSTAQYIPSERRHRLLARNGYRYAYDIQAAAPSLLFQRAQQINPEFRAPDLEYYINNRSQVRHQIAQEASTTVDVVKDVVNSLLQGSLLTTFSMSKLFQKLNRDYSLVLRLRQSATLAALRSDIAALWKCLRNEFTRTHIIDRHGRKRTRKLSSMEKASYYRQLEKQVARVIHRYLKKHSVRFLWVHDGWQCDQAIDPVELSARVRQQTGFVIKLDWTMHE